MDLNQTVIVSANARTFIKTFKTVYIHKILVIYPIIGFCSYCKSLLCSMFNEQTCSRFTRLSFVTMPEIAFMPIYIDFEH